MDNNEEPHIEEGQEVASTRNKKSSNMDNNVIIDKRLYKLQKEIEAVLFYKSEPVTVKDLCRVLSVTESEVKTALTELEHSLVGRGIVLVMNRDEYALTTSPETSAHPIITKDLICRVALWAVATLAYGATVATLLALRH